jgi:uncharacterized protein
MSHSSCKGNLSPQPPQNGGRRPRRGTNASNLPLAFSLLAKPTGAACNLACEYCFYLNKEQLYPDSRMRMAEEVLKAYLKQLLSSQQTAEVNVAWQGGEPTLMGLDFFKRSVALVKRYKRPGQHVSYSLQTNGTQLDETWCAFFKENDFLIGLSMDGPPKMHNAYRVDKGGQGSFEAVKRAWDMLQKYKVDTNILCAVHAANGSHPLEVYRFFRDELQAKFIQFIPIVERLNPEAGSQAGALVSDRSVGSEEHGRFLTDIFDDWLRRDVGSVFVQTFDSALASWCHLPASVCIFQETCGANLVLEHNGDLYSCDHFVQPAYRLGNILERPMGELAGLARQRQFGLDKRDRLPATCRRCNVRFACQGECPRNRFLSTPDGDEEGANLLCPGYREFFHHIDRPMRRMAELLRQGRAPAEIMQP